MKYPCNRVLFPDEAKDKGPSIDEAKDKGDSITVTVISSCSNCLPDCPGYDVDTSYQRAERLIQSANKSIDKAALLLRLAARILRQGMEMPENLAIYLADAFEVAAYKPAPERGRMLVRELHLSALNRRPLDVNRGEVAYHFEYCLSEGLTQNEAKLETAEEYRISPSSALSIWKEIKSKQAKQVTLPKIDQDDEIYKLAIQLGAALQSSYKPKLKRKAKLKR